MNAMIKESQLTAFAERIYSEQKGLFVERFAQYLKDRIESGEAQFENGQYMSFEEFETRFRREYLGQHGLNYSR